ncbi:MAG: hypothetical protein HC923_09330 [Myxococcales bacterium]|nr:hypothetical protein [Myxococcales bacterium]
MIPAEAPELLILVLVDEPKGSIYGGTVAAPAFRRIAQAALTARGTYVEAEDEMLVSDERGNTTEETWRVREPAPGAGDGKPASARAAAQTAGEGAEGKDRMPDLRGLTVRRVLEQCAATRCRPLFQGSGDVTAQRPSPGLEIGPGSVWRVTLGKGGGEP